MKTEILKPQYGQQMKFHLSNADEIFYGGAAGGGKSWSLMFEALRQIENPNYRAILFRRTFPEVKSTFIDVAYRMYEPLGLTPHDGGKEWWHKNGGRIKFSHLQHEKDVYKHRSAQYTFIGFDELTTFTEFQYVYLRSRNRTADKTLKKYICSASNPGGVGNLWVKKRFIDPMPPEQKLIVKLKNGHTLSRIFIPSNLYDNKILMQQDPNYESVLMSLPEKEKEALLYGNWDVFDGQYFTEFDRDVHVIKPVIPMNGIIKRIVAVDYGYNAPSSICWMSLDNQKNVIIYRNINQSGLLYKDIVRLIIENTTKEEEINLCIIDPSLVNKTSEHSGKTASKIMYEAGFSNAGIRIIAGNNNRITGANLYREYLQVFEDKNTGIKTSKLKFTENCLSCIETIPALVHDKAKIEDVDSSGSDHDYDSTRYGLMFLCGKGRDLSDMQKSRQILTKKSNEEIKVNRIHSTREETNLSNVIF